MLPSCWKSLPLEALVERLDSGVSVNGEDRAAQPNELGVLKISAVTSGTFDPIEHKVVNPAELERVRISPLRGRIIVSRSNTADLVGASAYVHDDHPHLFLSDKLWQIEPRGSEKVHMPWLAQWLGAAHVRSLLSKLATGTSGSMKNISKHAFLGLTIEVPPANEQVAIANALSVWDSAINATERLLANSWQQRQALLGLLLNTPVLPTPVEDRARTGSVPPSVQAGIPKLQATPKGWKQVALGKYLREVARPVTVQPEQGYDLVTVKRSRGGVYLRERLRGDAIKTPAQFRVEAGDFLISKRQIVHGACGIVPPALAGAIVSNEYAVLNSDGGIDLHFLRYLSESIYFQQTCYHSSIGVHVEKMIFNTERWLTLPFNLPPLDHQHEIVRELDAASAIVESTAAQVESLRREKSALMQQLLTGKRRVRLPASAEAASA